MVSIWECGLGTHYPDCLVVAWGDLMAKRKVWKLTRVRFSEVSAVDRPAMDFATAEHIEVLKRYGLTVPPDLEALMKAELPVELRPHQTVVRRFMERVMNLLYKREFSRQEREKLAAKGHAKPDGSYPIVTRQDLKNAVQAWGRGGATQSDKEHIVARAKAIGATDALPEDWQGSTKEKSMGVDIAYAVVKAGGSLLLRKSMIEVGQLAMFVCSLDCVVQQLAQERTAEGDVNPVVEELSRLRDELGDALVSLATHEVGEIKAEKPGEQQPAEAMM